MHDIITTRNQLNITTQHDVAHGADAADGSNWLQTSAIHLNTMLLPYCIAVAAPISRCVNHDPPKKTSHQGSPFIHNCLYFNCQT
jgi:hypothetical protein